MDRPSPWLLHVMTPFCLGLTCTGTLENSPLLCPQRFLLHLCDQTVFAERIPCSWRKTHEVGELARRQEICPWNGFQYFDIKGFWRQASKTSGVTKESYPSSFTRSPKQTPCVAYSQGTDPWNPSPRADTYCKLPKSCNNNENEISAILREAMRLPHKGRGHSFCVYHVLPFFSHILEHDMWGRTICCMKKWENEGMRPILPREARFL